MMQRYESFTHSLEFFFVTISQVIAFHYNIII
jgi:hypothetical protein